MVTTSPERPGFWAIAWRMGLRLAIVAGLAVLAHVALDQAMALSDRLPHETADRARCLILLGAALLYALVLAMPFVPGVEIGLALMVIRGAEIAPVVYLATVLGLSLAYIIGQLLPLTTLQRLFADLRLRRAAVLMETIAPLTPDERVERLRARLPERLAHWVIGARYLVLAVLLNLPLNAFLGGGGGLAMLAGMSRLYRPQMAIPVIALAVLPVPALVWLFGVDILPQIG